MATTADPRGSPPDVPTAAMFSSTTCFLSSSSSSSSHHARLSTLPSRTLTFHAQQPVHDEAEVEVAAEAEVTQREKERAVERPWNLRSRRRGGSSSCYSERVRFSVSLKAEEIEEDVYAVTGSRPRRRPKRRPRLLQRQLDALFPGMLLTEITVDSYKVPQS